MKYIVIGSEGFIGRRLCDYLEGLKSSVVRVDIRKSSAGNPGGQYHSIALEETGRLVSLCDKERPDAVFNLAGDFRPGSAKDLFNLNYFAPKAFLEASEGRKFKIIFVGSAAEYGIMKTGTLAREDFPLRPISDYGISKACQTLTALRFSRIAKHPAVVIARPFNIIGPGISESLFLGAFAKQIADIEKGIQAPMIKVGELESYRDLMPVYDAVGYLKVLADRASSGEVYNICSGRAVKIKEILKMLLSVSFKNITIKTDRRRFKVDEIRWSAGSNKKILKIAGEKAYKADLTETIRATLDWYRKSP